VGHAIAVESEHRVVSEDEDGEQACRDRLEWVSTHSEGSTRDLAASAKQMLLERRRR
jgi:hypothetical protein